VSGDGGTTPSFPNASNDTTPASLARSGHMRRWAVPSATVGGFTTTGTGSQQRVGVAPATASVAGALTAADFAKLARLQVPVQRLVYVASTDLLSGAAMTANTWNDVDANHNFTVASTASVYLVAVNCQVKAISGATGAELASRAIIDAAGTPQTVQLGGAFCQNSGNGAIGGGAFYVTGLAAGTHTIKVQVYGNAAWTAYCRASAQANVEFLNIVIYELSA